MKKNVLLFISFFITFSLPAQKNPCDTSLVKGVSGGFASDTIVVLENGTRLTFNRCEFFEIRNCVVYKEIRNLNDLKAAALTTLDDKGNVLFSCGMFILDFNSGGCGKKCMDVPVKISIPMLTSSCASSLERNQLYIADNGGRWQLSDSSYKEVIGADGKKYFEYYTRCSGKFNCDRKLNSTKVKLKSTKLKSIININISANCPMLNMNFTTGRRRNIVYAEIPCLNPDSLQLNVSGINKQGDNMEFAIPLSKCRSKYTRSSCNKISNKAVRHILGFIKLRERNIYRKYLID